MFQNKKNSILEDILKFDFKHLQKIAQAIKMKMKERSTYNTSGLQIPFY